VLFCELDIFLKHLQAGGIGVVPTDTVPGLVALPEYAQQIYTFKGRSPDKPLILFGEHGDALRPFTRGWLPAWSQLSQRGWPGPLTLVLPASDKVPFVIHRGNETVGIRVPKQPELIALLTLSGVLASTSVNLSGEDALTTPEQIAERFPDLLLLAGSYEGSGKASTVVHWQEAEWQWEVLRQGSFFL
jgi:L-threonylcarbamoyladenylate synthase